MTLYSTQTATRSKATVPHSAIVLSTLRRKNEAAPASAPAAEPAFNLNQSRVSQLLRQGFETRHSSTYELVLQQLAELEPTYQLRELDEVIAFLQRHATLLPVLHESTSHLQSAFGEATKVILEVEEDPESSFKQLVGLIQTAESPVVALAQLGRFDRAWWLDQASNMCGELLFHVEYVDAPTT